jgi:hypothetical protein
MGGVLGTIISGVYATPTEVKLFYLRCYIMLFGLEY